MKQTDWKGGKNGKKRKYFYSKNKCDANGWNDQETKMESGGRWKIDDAFLSGNRDLIYCDMDAPNGGSRLSQNTEIKTLSEKNKEKGRISNCPDNFLEGGEQTNMQRTSNLQKLKQIDFLEGAHTGRIEAAFEELIANAEAPMQEEIKQLAEMAYQEGVLDGILFYRQIMEEIYWIALHCNQKRHAKILDTHREQVYTDICKFSLSSTAWKEDYHDTNYDENKQKQTKSKKS